MINVRDNKGKIYKFPDDATPEEINSVISQFENTLAPTNQNPVSDFLSNSAFARGASQFINTGAENVIGGLQYVNKALDAVGLSPSGGDNSTLYQAAKNIADQKKIDAQGVSGVGDFVAQTAGDLLSIPAPMKAATLPQMAMQAGKFSAVENALQPNTESDQYTTLQSVSQPLVAGAIATPTAFALGKGGEFIGNQVGKAVEKVAPELGSRMRSATDNFINPDVSNAPVSQTTNIQNVIKTKGQETGNIDALAIQREAKAGEFGYNTGRMASDFQKLQNKQISDAVPAELGLFSPNALDTEKKVVFDIMKKGAKELNAKYSKLYKEADKLSKKPASVVNNETVSSIYTSITQKADDLIREKMLPPEDVTKIEAALKNFLYLGGLNKPPTPAKKITSKLILPETAQAGRQNLQDLISNRSPAPKSKTEGMTMFPDALQKWRRDLNRKANVLFKSASPADREQAYVLNQLKHEYDNNIATALDQSLLSSDASDAFKIYSKANAFRSKFGELYEGKKMVNRIINDEDITPIEANNMVAGAAAAFKQNAYQKYNEIISTGKNLAQKEELRSSLAKVRILSALEQAQKKTETSGDSAVFGKAFKSSLDKIQGQDKDIYNLLFPKQSTQETAITRFTKEMSKISPNVEIPKGNFEFKNLMMQLGMKIPVIENILKDVGGKLKARDVYKNYIDFYKQQLQNSKFNSIKGNVAKGVGASINTENLSNIIANPSGQDVQTSQ